MKVLVACEFSGRVRDAFLAVGCDAWSCDLLPTEVPGPHIEACALDVVGDGWDLLIAHPPCTYLSRAGARWMYPKAGVVCADRYQRAMAARDFFQRLLDAPVARVCVENPQPLKVVNLPTHSQVIQPFEFGHPYSKRTLLWLRGLPQLRPTNVLAEYRPFLRSNTGYGRRAGQSFSRGAVSSSKDASRTFEGIAEAMATQWGATHALMRAEVGRG